ncbi:hypothetical protein EDB92DRAFT_1866857 [Lactarius akahatsu]|uniref:Uncharacterized protein n=1 Tax=Lactarius akahatsu TaxID=416441 RepID=A0AAD4LFM7_9AGAM|nr:hypothetical protein EDB92DRAFT_1866857 [Lactarius akahatsu]
MSVQRVIFELPLLSVSYIFSTVVGTHGFARPAPPFTTPSGSACAVQLTFPSSASAFRGHVLHLIELTASTTRVRHEDGESPTNLSD